MKLSCPAVIAACMLLSAAPAMAQSMDRVVREQLEAANRLMAAEGLARDGEYRSGALRDGARRELQVPLERGMSYLIIGVCDADCSDLDLSLADAAGREVDSDYLADDAPIVTADVLDRGDYRLTVSMAACSIEPCGYGVAVFARRQ